MSYTIENYSELNALMLFNVDTTQEGIKIHSSAEPEIISAAQRLFDKGFISQVDGGYLTDLVSEASALAYSLFTMLNTK